MKSVEFVDRSVDIPVSGYIFAFTELDSYKMTFEEFIDHKVG
jgi:hypothetical protein